MNKKVIIKIGEDMKKGFTLIEILGAIVILGIIGLIVIPTTTSIIKNNKEKLYQAQLDKIEEACEKWAYENMNSLPDDGGSISITILTLKQSGLLPLDVRDPRTNKLFPNDMIVNIKNENNSYRYIVLEDSGTDLDNTTVETNSPTLVLTGDILEYVDQNSTYEEKGVTATSKSGEELDVNIIYMFEGKEVANIDTSYLRTYTVVYYANDTIDNQVYTSKITRTVVVR